MKNNKNMVRCHHGYLHHYQIKIINYVMHKMIVNKYKII